MKLSLSNPIVLFAALLVPCLAQENEPNNTIPTADSLPLNSQLIAASLSPRSDIDFWSFQMPSDGVVDLTLGQTSGSGSSLVQIAGLLQSVGGTELIDFVALDGRTASSTARVGLTRLDEAGAVITYVLQVAVAQFGSAQSYNLSATFTSDSFYEIEPNNSSTESRFIEIGETYQGLTNNTDDNDWFVFALDRDADVRISLRKDAQGPQTGPGHAFALYSSEIGATPIRQNVLSSGSLEALILEGLPARDSSGEQIGYFLQIARNTAVPAPQEYQLTVTATEGNFFEKLPNGSISTANPLLSLNGQNYSGRIAPRGDTDIFSFQLAVSGEVTVTLAKNWTVSSNLSRFEVEVYADSNLNSRLTSFLVRGDRLSNGITLDLSRFKSNGSTVETYYVLVKEGTSYTTGLDEYSLSVVGPGAIQELQIRRTSQSADGRSLNIVFDSVAATQYTVQSSRNLRNWSFVRNLTGSAGQSTTQVPIGSGNQYFRIIK